jgi:hypothetical protein
MKELHIDIETYSSINLNKSGVYRYAEAPDFEILLFGYAMDDGPVRVIDLAAKGKLPRELLDALTDDRITKWAFNANFETDLPVPLLTPLLPRKAYLKVSKSKELAVLHDLVCLPWASAVFKGSWRRFRIRRAETDGR